MSHYLKIGTGFVSITFLKQTLTAFELNYSQRITDFTITHPTGLTILFNWTGNQYQLEIENNLKQQLETFINNLKIYYSSLVTMANISKLNYFVSDLNTQTIDLSVQIRLNRFNNTNTVKSKNYFVERKNKEYQEDSEYKYTQNFSNFNNIKEFILINTNDKET